MNVKENYDLSTFKGTKKEFVKMLADACGISQKDSGIFTDAFLYVTEMFLSQTPEQKINFIGWGSFQVNTRQARKYRHPSDKTKIVHAPARRVVRFKPGKKLRDAVASNS